jgi:ubiquinone/menaquinone biosynthesis C-methylase UbiE
MLNIYGAKIGAKLLLHGQIKPGLKKLVRPVGYWRTVEYQLVLDEGKFQTGDRVLDIGSPKLLSLYIAKAFGAEVFATDIDDYFIPEYRIVRQFENVPPQQLNLTAEDGRKLSFPDNSFNKVFSISTLEHIPGEGDTECVKEMARVLADGGKCLFTVPFSPTSRVEYLDPHQMYWAKHSLSGDDGKVFYQRRYSEQDLFQRLIDPSELRIEKILYVGEKILANSQREFVDFLPVYAQPAASVFSKLLHTKPESSWRTLKKPLLAFVMLSK